MTETGNNDPLLVTKIKTASSIASMSGIVLSSNILQFIFSLILIRLLNPSVFGLFVFLFSFFVTLTTLIINGQTSLFVRERKYPFSHLIQIITINSVIVLLAMEPLCALFAGPYPEAARAGMILFAALLPACIGLSFISFSSKMLGQNTIFVPSLIKSLSYGLVTIVMALKGFGVFAFVYGVLVSNILFSALLSWKYRAALFGERLIQFKEYLNYMKQGRVFALLSIAAPALNNVEIMVVAALFPLETLGIYLVALKYSTMFNNFITKSMDQIVYSLFSMFSDDLSKTHHIYKDFTWVCFAILVPFYSFLSVFAGDLIRLVANDRWMPCARLISIGSLFYMIHFVSYYGDEILWTQKRERLVLFLTVARALLFILIGVILSSRYGIYGFLYSYGVQTLLSGIFYWAYLNDLRTQMHKNMLYIMLLFIPSIIVFICLRSFYNVFLGAAGLAVMYLIVARFVLMPFIRARFKMWFKEFCFKVARAPSI